MTDKWIDKSYEHTELDLLHRFYGEEMVQNMMDKMTDEKIR